MKTEALASQSADKYVIVVQLGESHSEHFMYSLPLSLHLSLFYCVVILSLSFSHGAFIHICVYFN